VNIKIVCRDLNASMAFYEALGFVRAKPPAGLRRANPSKGSEDADVANLLGLKQGTTIRSALLHLKGFTPGTHLQLLEFSGSGAGEDLERLKQVRDSLPRFAVTVSDTLDSVLANLRPVGLQDSSAPVTLREHLNVRAALVRDPDGVLIELIEPRADVLELRRVAAAHREGRTAELTVKAGRPLPTAARQASLMENW